MAGQEKEMGIQGLENYLTTQFPGSSKINTLLAQLTITKAELDKEAILNGGEENPFFYAEVRKQMELHSGKDLSDWVDSKGNVNINQINAVSKNAKKRFEIAKGNEVNQQEAKQDYQAQILEQQKEIIKKEFEKIDYDNLTADNLSFIAENMELFRETVSYNEYANAVETMGAVLGIKPNITDWMKLAKYQKDNPNEDLTSEQLEIFNSAPKELISQDKKSFNQEKMLNFDMLFGYTYQCIIDGIYKGKIPTRDEIIDKLIGKMDILGCSFPEELLDQLIPVETLEELNGKSLEEQRAIIEKKIQEQNEDRQSRKDISQNQFEESEEQMQGENDLMVADIFDMQRDYYKSGNDMQVGNFTQEGSEIDDFFDGFGEDVFDTLDNYGKEAEEDTFETLDNYDEGTEEAKEMEDYEKETTFKDNGPKGIAGFFASIVSNIKSLIPKKLQERFMSKDKQKQLPAGKPEDKRNEGMNKFDAEYSIHDPNSKFYMEEEPIAIVSENVPVTAINEHTAENGLLEEDVEIR